MITAALSSLALNTVLLIAGLVIDAVAVLVLVLSAVLGIKKGGIKAGWKLFWRVLAIAASAVITVVMGRIIAPILTSAAEKAAADVLPKKLLPFISENDTLPGILLSFTLPFAFLIVLLVISLLFLIPKIIIWNKAIEPACRKHHEKKPENAALSRTLGAVLNAVSAVLLLFAILMPLACPAERTVSLIDAANKADLTDIKLSSLSNPVFKACDAVMGKTVYEPISSFRTAFGYTDIFSEAKYTLDIYDNLKNNNDYDSAVRNANKSFRKSKLLPDVLSGAVLTVINGSTEIKDVLGPDAEIINEALQTVRSEFKGVKKSQMRGDADALFSLGARMQASGLLSAKTQKERDSALDLLLSENGASDICNDIYSSERAVLITEKAANSLYNSFMDKMTEGTDATYTADPFNLSELSKKEASDEISNITSTLNNLSNFSETLNSYNNAKKEGKPSPINSIDLASLGKALDTMNSSSVLAPCYEDLMNAAENILPHGESDSDKIDFSELIRSAKEAESKTSYLGSAQGLAGLGETLADRELNEEAKTENLKKSVDIIIDNIDARTADRIGDDIATVLNVDNNPQAVDFITEYTKQIAAEKEENIKNPSEQTALDAEKDAQALAAIYRLLEHSGEKEVNIPESELYDSAQKIAASDMITRTMADYAERGETLGLAEALSENDKSIIIAGLDSADIPETNRQAALDFLKLNNY